MNPQLQTVIKGFVSDEVKTLLNTIRDDIILIKNKNNDMLLQEEIDIYISSLVFDILISKLRELVTIDSLKDFLWN